jgi:hypothetical protein
MEPHLKANRQRHNAFTDPESAFYARYVSKFLIGHPNIVSVVELGAG